MGELYGLPWWFYVLVALIIIATVVGTTWAIVVAVRNTGKPDTVEVYGYVNRAAFWMCDEAERCASVLGAGFVRSVGVYGLCDLEDSSRSYHSNVDTHVREGLVQAGLEHIVLDVKPDESWREVMVYNVMTVHRDYGLLRLYQVAGTVSHSRFDTGRASAQVIDAVVTNDADAAQLGRDWDAVHEILQRTWHRWPPRETLSRDQRVLIIDEMFVQNCRRLYRECAVYLGADPKAVGLKVKKPRDGRRAEIR